MLGIYLTKHGRMPALALALCALAIAIACGGSGTAVTPGVDAGAAKPDAEEHRGAGGLSAILATKDLGVGPNRISFLLTTPRSLVTVPQATMASYYRDDVSSPDAVRQTVQASFHLWPYGTRGNYAADLDFDRQGKWELVVTVDDGAETLSTVIPLQIEERSSTPSLGVQPPLTPSKTVRSVDDPASLTSSSMPDLDLYQHSVADIVNNGRPALVVFASPAFCTTPTCGPQVETVQGIKDLYHEEVDFVHVEVYDNPQAIQGDLARAKYAPAARDWGLTDIDDYLNESWVFILDRDGRITRKYEGFASASELEQGLAEVL